jgi:hypothetical protein
MAAGNGDVPGLEAEVHRDPAGDERERLADARDRVADQRDRVADARDRAADRRDATMDRVLALRDDRILALAEEVDGLTTAMEHRSVIEQAKGVIMHAMQCSADAAFAVLVAQSQAENRKVRDVALDLAAAQDNRPPA